MPNSDCELCSKVRDLIEQTRKEVKKLESKAERNNKERTPVDSDFVRTYKAMFYEKVAELFYKQEEQQR